MTTIDVAIVERAVTKERAIQKKWFEPIYKTDTKKLRKEIKSNNYLEHCYFYRKDGRAISLLGSKGESQILLSQKLISIFGAPI